MEEGNFDKRIVARKIKRGDVEQTNYDRFMEELEDCSENATEVETKFIRKVESKSQEETEDTD